MVDASLRRALGSVREDVLVAVLAALAAIGGSYALVGWTPRFVVVPIDQFVIDATPSWIVTWVILNLGENGHLLHQALAAGIATLTFGSAAVLGRIVGRWRRDALAGIVVGGLAASGATGLITDDVVSALAAGVSLGLVLAGAAMSVDSAAPGRERRNVLGLVGAAAGFLGLSYLGGGSSGVRGGTEPLPDETGYGPLLADARERSMTVDGLDGLLSSIPSFYSVDIASATPRIDREDWTLRITGAVDEEVTITYDDLTDREPEHRFITLRCVSDSLNGGLMDTALWTGVPVAEFVEMAAPETDCECVMLRADDGYYERFPLEALERTFLAYGMNGRTLPGKHGAPVRALVPGHWGEINVKWLTEIEILEEELEGYWEQAGWHGTGPVKTVAKLSVQNRIDAHQVEVAGHAYAGTRGISGVEVSLDDGESWHDAELGEALPGEDVWRQWRYAFDPDGIDAVVVRAIEADGTVQPSEETDPYPSGPSGWVREPVR